MASKPPPSTPAWKQPASFRSMTVWSVSCQPFESAKVTSPSARCWFPVGVIGVDAGRRDRLRHEAGVRRRGTRDGEQRTARGHERVARGVQVVHVLGPGEVVDAHPERVAERGDDGGDGEVERLAVRLAVDLEQRRAVARDQVGGGVAQRLEEARFGEADEATRVTLSGGGLDDVRRVAGLQLRADRLAVLVVRRGVGRDRDLGVRLHVVVRELLVRALEVVRRGEGEAELVVGAGAATVGGAPGEGERRGGRDGEDARPHGPRAGVLCHGQPF